MKYDYIKCGDYIGYEICKEYFNIAKERINKRKNELIEAKK